MECIGLLRRRPLFYAHLDIGWPDTTTDNGANDDANDATDNDDEADDNDHSPINNTNDATDNNTNDEADSNTNNEADDNEARPSYADADGSVGF